MEASNLTAEVNDHGPYFARVIQAWTYHWVTHHLIPHFKQGHHVKVKSLMNDEDVELAVGAYLRLHKFCVTPTKLKDYLEKEIFPKLSLLVKPTTI